MQRTGANGKVTLYKIYPLLLILLLFIADQLTKSYCKNLHDNCGWVSTSVIKDFFYFTYTENSGAAWSFLADKSWAQAFFIALTSVALVLFYAAYIYYYKRDKNWMKVALIFVISGTLGNFADRLVYGKVVDFISFIFGGKGFPIFNLADSFMTVGVIIVIINFLFIDDNALLRFGKKDEDGKVSGR